MFVWFVFRDSKGSLWQSGVYRANGAKKSAYNRYSKAAPPVDMRNGSYSIKGGTKSPLVTGFVREFCANNAAGTPVGVTFRAFDATRLVLVGQSSAGLGVDCTVPVRLTGLSVPKGSTLTVSLELNTAKGNGATRTVTITGT
jgi:hypothetical protein